MLRIFFGNWATSILTWTIQPAELRQSQAWQQSKMVICLQDCAHHNTVLEEEWDGRPNRTYEMDGPTDDHKNIDKELAITRAPKSRLGHRVACLGIFRPRALNLIQRPKSCKQNCFKTNTQIRENTYVINMNETLRMPTRSRHPKTILNTQQWHRQALIVWKQL